MYYTNVFATGVPAVIAISREIRMLKADYEQTRHNWQTAISEMQTKLLDHLDEQPAKFVAKLVDRFQIDGVRPITRDDIRESILDIINSASGPFVEVVQSLRRLESSQHTTNAGTVASSSSSLPSDTSRSIQCPNRMHLWKSDSRLHYVPENFKFPSQYVGTMWHLWLFGNSSEEICAYRAISSRFDLTSRSCAVNFSRCGRVMDKLIEIAVNDELIATVGDISKENENHFRTLLQQATGKDIC